MNREQSKILRYEGQAMDYADSSNQVVLQKNVLRDPEFSGILKQSVKDGMKKILGSDSAIASLDYSIASMEKPSEYETFLHSMFGSGSYPFEKAILEELYRKVNLQFRTQKGYRFSDYVDQAGRTFLELRVPSIPESPNLDLSEVLGDRTADHLVIGDSELETPDLNFKVPAFEDKNMTNVIEDIRSLKDESNQISDLEVIEHSYSIEAANILRDMIRPLGRSFHINPELYRMNDFAISDIVLTPDAELQIFSDNAKVISKSLESIPTDLLVGIVAEVMPNVENMIYERNLKLRERRTAIQKLTTEIRKILGIHSSLENRP